MKSGQGTEEAEERMGEPPLACSDEAAAVELIEQLRWQGHAACPRCDSTEVSQLRSDDGTRSARFLWRCHACKRQFTVRIGTFLEDSRVPLRTWCRSFWAASTVPDGVAAAQISREGGITYKSALFLLQRMRFAVRDPSGSESGS